jgi:hypothetical protein
MQKTQRLDKTKKIIEITLSIIGGLHNLSGSLIELILPNLGAAHGSTGSFGYLGTGVLAVSFALLTITAILFISKKPKIAGWMLIISSIGGLISISVFYILASLLVFIAGVMCLTTTPRIKSME